MKNKNVLLLGVLIALVAVAAVLGAVLPRGAGLPGEDAPTLDVTLMTEPAASPTAQEATQQPDASPDASEPAAYLVVTVHNVVYDPIPLTMDGYYTINQPDTGAQNLVHVTPTSVTMHASTCENQDCVGQGEVTLDNRDTRVLGNMIICLPNQVTLALYTPDELDSILTLE